MTNDTTSAETIVRKLKEMKSELATRYKVREFGLFGSWIREEQQAGSDIDLLVEFDEEADLFDMIGLSLYLEEIFGRSVDVVPRDALREELRDSVLRQVVLV